MPRLKAVPGVADVNVFGGDIQQLQIQVDPLQLHRFNLTLEEIIQAAARPEIFRAAALSKTTTSASPCK